MSENRKLLEMNVPMWFDGKSINEALFCEDFLRTRQIIFANGAFFTPDGRVTDDLPLRGEIFEELKYCAVNNIPRKISNIIEIMKLAAHVEDFPPEQDRIHLANGTLMLDGTFTEGKPDIVRNRLPVFYRPDTPKPVLWLSFLNGLLYPEDIPTLQEFIGYCLIPSNKGQRMMVITGEGIYGVKFVLYDAGKNPIGEYATDQDGYIYIDDELTPGKYYIRELEAAEGYIRDEQYKTVYVEAGKCAQIEWENSAVTGQIQVRKYSADDNLVTGQRAGSALEGAVFEITQARSGKVVGYIVTDARGVAASDPLPLGRYFVTEVSAPKYYQLSSEKMEAEIEYPNQIIKLSAYNKSANLGVTIKKTGNREVQPGQVMSYDFSGIGNTSNVALNSFFWHDRIPTDATRAISVTTGTYNARLYYKVTFKTNLSDYRTLASNLLTSNNYSLSLNAATLGLAQGEYVTDVRFEFGTVPSGFASVVKPTMRVQVLGTVSNGYQIINRADVGGQYLNEWQTAKATWVTTVCRFNNNPLPKTGY